MHCIESRERRVPWGRKSGPWIELEGRSNCDLRLLLQHMVAQRIRLCLTTATIRSQVVRCQGYGKAAGNESGTRARKERDRLRQLVSPARSLAKTSRRRNIEAARICSSDTGAPLPRNR